MFNLSEEASCQHLVTLALKEDLSSEGDLTSHALIPFDQEGQAVFVARAPGVLAGMPAAKIVLYRFDLSFEQLVPDGTELAKGDKIGRVSGRLIPMLMAERVALNFLQHLSGIATQTRCFLDAVALPKVAKEGIVGTATIARRFIDPIVRETAQILDTRKTTPGWRLLEKYAVRCGGGQNHRIGLYDGVLIKDNHLAALGSGPAAVTAAIRKARQEVGHSVPVEVEVENFEQLDDALAERPDIILLDNMTLDQMREAVRRRNAIAPEVKLEASGGVTLANVRAVAETGVDRISVGALTHSAPALDIALDYVD